MTFIPCAYRADVVGKCVRVRRYLLPPMDLSVPWARAAFYPCYTGRTAAIELMRRSIAAVDAFVGEGAAAKSPDLVAALMSATIQCENRMRAANPSCA